MYKLQIKEKNAGQRKAVEKKIEQKGGALSQVEMPALRGKK
jgi:hypothetical protein